MTEAAYPHRWAVDTLLKDGAAVHVRPVRPADAPALVRFHEGLSRETIYRRFFAWRPHLSEPDVERFTTVDYRDRMAFVAVLEDAIIGVGRYDRQPGTDEAEVAFAVADAHQGRGLGSLFLEYLAAAARECGITRFVADTLPYNREMLDVFRSVGFRETTLLHLGVVRVVLDIRPTDSARARAEQREWSAVAHSISRLLGPRSIAVVGVGRREGSVGRILARNLVGAGFRGPVYAVGPHAGGIEGVDSYAEIGAIPGEVDLAVLAVPAPTAIEVVDACAAKGVRGLVVVSSGFSETGAEGADLERRLVQRAHRGGMRLIGPNCIGVINTAPGVRMDATFMARTPSAGHIAFASQSGALGMAMLERAGDLGLGISSFVSMGNKVDVSSNDLLRYWEGDPATRVILLYLESFGNPRTFSRVARRVSRSKPIVAVKAGRSAAGVRAAATHTAALASPDASVDALFRQAGVIRVETLEELFDVGAVLEHQPLPKGRRVAVVGNARGAGILAADALVRDGLEVVEFDGALRSALEAAVPSAVAVGNPVDLGAGGGADTYRAALTTVLGSPQVDAVIAVHAPVPATPLDEVGRVISEAASTGDKTVVCTVLGMVHASAIGSDDGRIPCFAFPESAARALARVAGHAAWRARPEAPPTALEGIDREAAAALVAADLARRPQGGWLGPEEVTALLSTHGIPTGPATAPAGVEVIIGLAHDPVFGPLLMFGSGGVGVELFGDRAFRALPLSQLDARELVRSIRGAPLLLGHRGSAPVDVAALEDALLRVARLAEDVHEVAEMDLNPVIVSTGGIAIVDARVRITPVEARADLAVRRLRPVTTRLISTATRED